VDEQKEQTRADWIGRTEVSGSGAEEVAEALREVTGMAERPKCQEGAEDWLAPLAAAYPALR